jgi:hypothetical protein
MPCDTDAIFERSSAESKQHFRITGDHLGYGPNGPSDRSGQREAGMTIATWISEQFG